MENPIVSHPTTTQPAPSGEISLPMPKRSYNSARSVYREFDLDDFIVAQGIDAVAEAYLRSSAARRSRNATGNVSNTITIPSFELGYALTAESLGVEYPGFLHYLADPSVVRIWDQAGEVVVHGVNPVGKPFTIRTKPDGLVVRRVPISPEHPTGFVIEVVEFKAADELAKLCLESPNRYKCIDGIYRSLPLEQHFEKMGMRYVIKSQHDMDKRVVQAARFLRPYVAGNLQEPATEEEVNAFLETASTSPGAFVREVPVATPARRAELFYHLVARRIIFTHLSECEITEPDHQRIYPTPQDERAFALFTKGTRRSVSDLKELGYHLRPGSLLELNGARYEVVSINSKKAVLRDIEGESRSMELQAIVDLKPRISRVLKAEMTFEMRFRTASLADRLVYLTRRIAIDEIATGRRPRASIPDEHLRAWEDEGDLGLLPKHYNCGNRKSRIADDVAECLKKLLDEHYMRPGTRKSPKYIRKLLTAAKDAGEIKGKIPHLATVYEHCNKIDQYEKVCTRMGKAFGRYWQPIVLPNHLVGSPRGQRDFQIAHVDSTIEDLLQDERDGSKKIRSYVSLMVDSFTGEVLAVYRARHRPNEATIRGLLLDCIARHGSIPGTITCDWGSEHRTVWFQKSLTRIGTSIHYRPKRSPRHGSMVETRFAALLEEVFKNAEGCTELLKSARLVTAAVNPENHALWTNDLIEDLVQEYISLRNRLPTKSSPSPQSLAAAIHLKLGPPPAARITRQELELELLPFVDRRWRVVDPRGFVVVDDGKFYADELRKFPAKRVLVRKHENDNQIVYVTPPERQSMIECKRVNFGGPSDETKDQARILDDEKLGPSPIPEVSHADVIRARVARKNLETEQRLRKAKAEAAAPKPPPAPDKSSLKPFSFTAL